MKVTPEGRGVAIAEGLPDPPSRPPFGVDPRYEVLEAGEFLRRIYTPESFLQPWPHTVGPTTFRHFGPTERFDHHQPGSPSPDARRGIYYAGAEMWDCAVEVFWRTRIIRLANNRFAEVLVQRDLRLLDISSDGAMRIGATAALSKGGPREKTQSWARHIYNHSDTYRYDGLPIDGLMYSNSHNEGRAVALFERASDSLRIHSDRALSNATIRAALEMRARTIPSLTVEA